MRLKDNSGSILKITPKWMLFKTVRGKKRIATDQVKYAHHLTFCFSLQKGCEVGTHGTLKNKVIQPQAEKMTYTQWKFQQPK